MIQETYAIFASWDFDSSVKANFARLKQTNLIGARSTSWLRDVIFVLNRRFNPNGRDRALVRLAQKNCSMEEWKPILLWHLTRDEFLLRDFLLNWLFPQYVAGVYRLRTEDLYAHLRSVEDRGGINKRYWSETTLSRVASALLKIGVDFGLLRGTTVKEFTTFALPERSFLYLLYALKEEVQNPGKIVASNDWRIFLMSPEDVELELLRLHQYHKVDYQVAGSIVSLSLPYANVREYVENMLA